MSVTIVVATTNAGKMRELSAMLEGDVRWLSLKDFPGVDEVVEDGLSFGENARKKALGYAQSTGFWTIADDSGLVIDALDGAPGIHSARFSGVCEKGSERGLIDHRNIEKVLKLMVDVPEEKRTARFVCSLCLASPEKILAQTEGRLEGKITTEPVGTGGFGYDPIMFVSDKKRTVGQLSREEKNSISHRGGAIRKLQPLLADLLAGGN